MSTDQTRSRFDTTKIKILYREHERAEDRFRAQLTELFAVSNELAKAASLDDLCRQAIELGRSQLGFDRMGIWFLDEDTEEFVGTFSTDRSGRIRDDRQLRHPVDTSSTVGGLISKNMLAMRRQEVTAPDPQDENLGPGTRAVATLWDGANVIGFVTTDNFLKHEPITDRQAELLLLYASIIGQLCMHKRTELELREWANVEQEFHAKLRTLQTLSNELSKVATLDDLCRQAVVLGRSHLGFEWMEMWFVADTPDMLRGAFTANAKGEVVDRRAENLSLDPDSLIRQIIRENKPQTRTQELRAPATDEDETEVMISRALAALWDGEKVTGCLVADNLLARQPITEVQCEVLSLYAAAVGHLCSLKRAEEQLSQRANEERAFQQKLRALNTVSNELSLAATVDDLFRRAVELGRTALGFERLAVWLVEQPGASLRGTFAIDEQDRLRDDRTVVQPIQPDSQQAEAMAQNAPAVIQREVKFRGPDGKIAGYGLRVVAALSDGEKIVGCVSTDNLLSHQPITSRQSELLGVFAATLGHLYSLKRAQEALSKAHDDLERRVEQRTAQLTRANVELKHEIGERQRAEDGRRELADQLRHAQKMEAVGRLAGGIAHDFNNLLMVIRGYADMALEDLKPGQPLQREVSEIQKATDRAGTLIRQLLAFGRKQVLKPKVLDLNAILTTMSKMLPRLIGEHVELVIRPGDSIGSVKADPAQIEQVIMNLALNARDAMPGGGKLTIETSNTDFDAESAKRYVGLHPGPYVLLSVSDTGGGIAEEIRPHVFEPFFTTQVDKGSGLGLASVYGIVKQSGGHIWFSSAPGQGTTFNVYLPRIPRAAETVHGAPEPAGKSPRGSETILLAEDGDDVRELVTQVLKTNGYTVLAANCGAEALALADKHRGRIHLLLTDVVMPGISGGQLAEQLRAKRPDIHVIYMSGYTDDAIVHHGVLNSGTTFLQKPVSPQTLTHKVREVLDAPAKH
ncbi:MAG: response regulator [Verrucomicrobia bacterium]|nr:response regulator [Verrucomicrobiota bacterium]